MLAGRYKILQIIGEGSTSTVYRAFDTHTKREVAIKSKPLAKTNRLHLSDFSKGTTECALHKNLEHEHILGFIDYLEMNGRYYLILELCSHSLITLANEYEMNLRGIKRIMRMALLGLRYLHNQGIIHRDIKLSNMLVQDDIIKLCDFGLACFENDCNYEFCGTREYLAPEIIYGMKRGVKIMYTTKIDIYALGIAFKALLTRKKDINIMEMARFGTEIGKFASKILDKEPKERYSAEEALKDAIFDKLFVAVPDFRLIKNFSRVTKYGEVERAQNYCEIKYNDRLRENKIRIEYAADICNCRGVFKNKVFVNKVETIREYLTELQLKHYNYLCAYMRMKCDRTIKYKKDLGKGLIKVFISGGYQYENEGMIIEFKEGLLKLNGEELEDSGKVPENRIRYFKDAIRECERELANICVCGQWKDNEGGSTMSVVIPDDPLGGFQRIFVLGLGWCIREGGRFNFLLNDGKWFAINGLDFTLIFNSGKYSIEKGMKSEHKKLLKIARVFLTKFLNTLVAQQPDVI